MLVLQMQHRIATFRNGPHFEVQPLRRPDRVPYLVKIHRRVERTEQSKIHAHRPRRRHKRLVLPRNNVAVPVETERDRERLGDPPVQVDCPVLPRRVQPADILVLGPSCLSRECRSPGASIRASARGVVGEASRKFAFPECHPERKPERDVCPVPLLDRLVEQRVGERLHALQEVQRPHRVVPGVHGHPVGRIPGDREKRIRHGRLVHLEAVLPVGKIHLGARVEEEVRAELERRLQVAEFPVDLPLVALLAVGERDAGGPEHVPAPAVIDESGKFRLVRGEGGRRVVGLRPSHEPRGEISPADEQLPPVEDPEPPHVPRGDPSDAVAVRRAGVIVCERQLEETLLRAGPLPVQGVALREVPVRARVNAERRRRPEQPLHAELGDHARLREIERLAEDPCTGILESDSPAHTVVLERPGFARNMPREATFSSSSRTTCFTSNTESARRDRRRLREHLRCGGRAGDRGHDAACQRTPFVNDRDGIARRNPLQPSRVEIEAPGRDVRHCRADPARLAGLRRSGGNAHRTQEGADSRRAQPCHSPVRHDPPP